MQRQGFRRRRPITALGALVAIFAFGASAAEAATRQVSPAGANSGACISSPCLTIQYAVEQAVANDTIEVGPGTYAAGASINKPLTLVGAQAGINARTRSVPDAQESSSRRPAPPSPFPTPWSAP